ncbi:glycosyltransferase family 2 protein [Megasphaera elsdenii]|uniref:glycosyltransferase family 2 protein n=1 Tax=Megasphaera elsdenii TaxID=907 RepID=UPI0036F28C2A
MISIALCTYNGEKYIGEQLQSIMQQTLQPDEIVICDDQSKDRTIDVIKNTLKYWNGNWRLIQNSKNLGYKKNFQKVISLCQGDVIFLCDQDDVWEQRKLEVMVPVFNDPNVILAFHDADIVNENLETIRSSFWNELDFDIEAFQNGDYSCLLIGNFIQGAASGFRKSLFKQSIPFPNTAFHDEWLALNAAFLGKIVPVPQLLLKYRQRGNNALGGPQKNTLAKKIQTWFCEFQNKKNEYKAYQKHEFDLWKVLVTKYPNGIIGKIKSKDFFEFLYKREKGLFDRSYNSLPSLTEYQKFYAQSSQGRKQWLKDKFLSL